MLIHRTATWLLVSLVIWFFAPDRQSIMQHMLAFTSAFLCDVESVSGGQPVGSWMGSPPPECVHVL